MSDQLFSSPFGNGYKAETGRLGPVRFVSKARESSTLVAVAPQTIGTSSNPVSCRIGNFGSEQEVWILVAQALKILTAAKAAAVRVARTDCGAE